MTDFNMKDDIKEIDSSDKLISTESPASTIKAIDKTTVHRICSGQVVLSLATAVKELVENSLDAGATCIEVRLKEYGSSLIEVSDNGRGVQPSDFVGLALKHHTSKLENFNDLTSVKTFGFRGEALSSLCALCNLTITTRHAKQMVGSKLVYDSDGQLIEKISISRNVGTTVSLNNIFYTLPVRHNEFKRNLKKEFNKMTQILYSYCLISSNIRISCTNQCDKGKKTTIVSTDVHSLMKENITAIFGVKQLTSLLEIKQTNPNTEILAHYGVDLSSEASLDGSFKLNGFVSSCAHGQGRSSADRQFYFINNRPCDPVKISRLVNEIYHHYNKSQFPMIVLNIQVSDDDVDINVTPDKRQILVNREKLLLATIKMTLVSLYEHIPSTYNIQKLLVDQTDPCHVPQAQSRLASLCKEFVYSPKNSSPLFKCGIKRSISLVTNEKNNGIKQPKIHDLATTIKVNTFSDQAEKCKSPPNHEAITVFPIQDNMCSDEVEKCESLLNHEEIAKAEVELLTVSESILRNSLDDQKSEGVLIKEEFIINNKKSILSNLKLPDYGNEKTNCVSPKYSEVFLRTSSFINDLLMKKAKNGQTPKIKEMVVCSGDNGQFHKKLENKNVMLNSDSKLIVEEKHSPIEVIILEETDNVDTATEMIHSVTVKLSLLTLKEKLKARKDRRIIWKVLARNFRATISPNDNKSAEEELKRVFSKSMFKEMEILGQFNLGFIITRHASDLFIIDQHATDEKYNFEILQSLNAVHNQKLIIPQQLELTVVNEGILIDNIDIFLKNGFEFFIDEKNQLGRRVHIISIPHSRGWEFGKEDIEEMIFMLSDSPGIFCRPSRVRSMFASRACRKSVMIGTPLGIGQMRTLIDHMGEIEQPWNCPHGRPTMRHLINLNVLTNVHF